MVGSGVSALAYLRSLGYALRLPTPSLVVWIDRPHPSPVATHLCGRTGRLPLLPGVEPAAQHAGGGPAGGAQAHVRDALLDQGAGGGVGIQGASTLIGKQSYVMQVAVILWMFDHICTPPQPPNLQQNAPSSEGLNHLRTNAYTLHHYEVRATRLNLPSFSVFEPMTL